MKRHRSQDVFLKKANVRKETEDSKETNDDDGLWVREQPSSNPFKYIERFEPFLPEKDVRLREITIGELKRLPEGTREKILKYFL